MVVATKKGVDHNSGHPSKRPRDLMRNRLIAQALHRLILQLRLVLAGFMIKATKNNLKEFGFRMKIDEIK
jgi:hypothetical protein